MSILKQHMKKLEIISLTTLITAPFFKKKKITSIAAKSLFSFNHTNNYKLLVLRKKAVSQNILINTNFINSDSKVKIEIHKKMYKDHQKISLYEKFETTSTTTPIVFTQIVALKLFEHIM